MSKDLEDKINDIHDAVIRFEAVCSKVEKHEKTLYNNGWGIAAQVKVLWLLAVGIWTVALIWLKKVI